MCCRLFALGRDFRTCVVKLCRSCRRQPIAARSLPYLIDRGRYAQGIVFTTGRPASLPQLHPQLVSGRDLALCTGRSWKARSCGIKSSWRPQSPGAARYRICCVRSFWLVISNTVGVPSVSNRHCNLRFLAGRPVCAAGAPFSAGRCSQARRASAWRWWCIELSSGSRS